MGDIDSARLPLLQAEAELLGTRMSALPHAWGGPPATGVLRTQPEDFRVDEVLKSPPSGVGSHWWLRVEKRSVNTQWVIRELSRHFSVQQRDIGYGGLKDRHAVATQWFSVPDAEQTESRLAALPLQNSWRVLEAVRHERKLRHGVVAGNRFSITVRNFRTETSVLHECIARIGAAGVPNYFTEQRFGFDNLGAAATMFAGAAQSRVGQHERGLYLSAARSALFNWVLAQRVEQGTWNSLQAGEAVTLAGTNSFFVAVECDEMLRERLQQRDVAPSAPLWGEGELPTAGVTLAYEITALAPFPEFALGLARAGLRQERRSTILYVIDMQHDYDATACTLSIVFFLPAGCFATAVLREIARY